MSQILKSSSFSLIRTNAKLTTNIKIIADSRDRVFLESFDANPILSQSQYKAFEVTGGNYSFDLNRFYSQGSLLSPDIAFSTYEKDDSTQIKNNFSEQYDFFYAMGTQPKNSKLYNEELSMFFPLWVDASNIPDYFLIFKIDGPMTLNINDSSIKSNVDNFDSSSYLEDLIKNPTNFYSNYIKSSRIIKSFDLTGNSAIGRYIRKHATDPNIPSSSIYASLNKGDLTYWKGISYDQGGFCSKGLETYIDYTLIDKTLIESDDYLTIGFKKNKVVHPNILNLEFLFDDPEHNSTNNYEFSRYFGLYVSESELGQFYLSGDRLFDDRFYESNQSPVPYSNTIGFPQNQSSQIISNPNGVKIYPNIQGSTPGSTSIFSGRLLNWNEVQNPRFPYVKDVNGNFYSVNSSNSWISSYIASPTSITSSSYSVIDDAYLRLKNKSIDLKNFTGFNEAFAYVPYVYTEKIGTPSFSFSVIDSIISGDEIRISIIDPTNTDVDYYTIIADSGLSAGEYNGITFSPNGNTTQVADAISNAINNIGVVSGEYQIFTSINVKNTVVVYFRIHSEEENTVKYSFFTTSNTFPWSLPNIFIQPTFVTNYVLTPVQYNSIGHGLYYSYHFTGGCNNPKARFSVSISEIQSFFDPLEPVYIKTDVGYCALGDYSPYLDEPVFNELGDIISFNNIFDYVTFQITDTTQNIDFPSIKKILLYKYGKNTNGYLSVFPIRDFDFDFFDTSYNSTADSYPSSLYNWYISGPTGITGNHNTYIPTFNYTNLVGGTSFIDTLIGPNSDFVVKGRFQTLISEVDEILDTQSTITNEYDRLKENVLSDLAISSRVVPFINKWVYEDEGTDVRENPYRLNADQSFGFSNFSPSLDEYEHNPKFFTHEWYYLQEYPPYLSFQERLDSYSYFDNPIYNNYFPLQNTTGSTAFYSNLIGGTGLTANLFSIHEDYFSEYFVRNSVTGFPNPSSPIIPEIYAPKQYRYSIFKEGSSVKFPETMFRGAKVLIKDRTENSHLNYNLQNINLVPNTLYNGYKFSSVLTYGSDYGISIIKNDAYSNITIVIQADIADEVFLRYKYDGGLTGNFIDRSSLYTLTDKIGYSENSFDYIDTNVSGQIGSWSWDYNTNTWNVVLTSDQYGNYPNITNQVNPNINGGYNPLYTVPYYGINIKFDGVVPNTITSNSFNCNTINVNINETVVTLNGSSIDNVVVGQTGIIGSPPTSLLGFQSFISNPSGGQSTFDIVFTSNIKYTKGGYNYYKKILNQISFANIANDINSGNPLVKYINVDKNGNITFDSFCLEIASPDYVVKSTYLKTESIKQIPLQLQNYKGVIGYDLTSSSRAILNQIIRHRGGYDPKFKDLVKFIDVQDIINSNLIDNNIQILTTETQTIGATNTYTVSDSNISTIDNLFFNKVNIQNSGSILITDGVYPLIGEIAIDKSDFFIFKSNWDTGYYKQYPKTDISEPIIGTRENQENISFFGSKVLSIPDTISIEIFPQGIISPKDLISPSRINSVSPNLVGSTSINGNRLQLTIEAYIDLALQDFLISDGIDAPFIKYLNPNYLKGKDDIQKYVKEYIVENIKQRYYISNITFWEAFWKKGNSLPLVQCNLSDKEKIAAGYVKSKNFTTYSNNPEDLNFTLIYNIPKDRNASIAFSIQLKKK